VLACISVETTTELTINARSIRNKFWVMEIPGKCKQSMHYSGAYEVEIICVHTHTQNTQNQNNLCILWKELNAV